MQLVQSYPADFQSEDRARRVAQSLASKHAAVIARSREANPTIGKYGEQTIDGDTIKYDDINMRDMDRAALRVGLRRARDDAAEVPMGLKLARAARAQMQKLLDRPGVQVIEYWQA